MLGSATLAAGAISREMYVALVAAVALSIVASAVAVRVVGSRPHDDAEGSPAGVM